jgi:hypothetical protein
MNGNINSPANSLKNRPAVRRIAAVDNSFDPIEF